METTAPTSRTVDRSTLARLKTPEGKWQKTPLEALSSGQWARWFMNRIEGEDPYFPYRRGEYPQGANDLFFNLFRKQPDLDTEPASEGLGIYLRYLHWRHVSDDLEEPLGIEVQQALELLLAVRARDTRARSVLRRVLRDFILDGLLLNRTEDESPHPVSAADLHREALVALSVLQQRGDTSDWDVWNAHRTEETFSEQYDASFDPRFALTAFSGIALSASTPADLPDGMVADLLRLVDEAEQTLRPRHSLEALFVDRPDQRQQVLAYLWEEIDGLDDPERQWARVRRLLDRHPGEVPSYDRMAKLQQNGVADANLPRDSWREDSYEATRERDLVHT